MNWSFLRFSEQVSNRHSVGPLSLRENNHTFTTKQRVHMGTTQMQKAPDLKEKCSGGIMLISVYPVTNKNNKKRRSGLSSWFSFLYARPPKQTKAWLNSVCVQGIRRWQEEQDDSSLNRLLIISFQHLQSTWYQSTTWLSRKRLYHTCQTLDCGANLNHGAIIFGLQGNIIRLLKLVCILSRTRAANSGTPRMLC